jgi:hypothetical protein
VAVNLESEIGNDDTNLLLEADVNDLQERQKFSGDSRR